MMALLGLLGALLVCAGIVLIGRTRGGIRLLLEVWRRPTTPISAIGPGVMELAGTLSADGEPVAGLSTSGCVAVKTRVIGFSGLGKNQTNLGGRSVLRASRGVLRDSTGSCLIDLEDAELVGELFSSPPLPFAEVEKDLPPWARDLAPPSATFLAIEEIVVPVGSSVMVTAVTRKQEQTKGLYRDSLARFELGGTEERRVLLTVGGQNELFRRSGVAVLLALSGGFCMVVQGIALLLVGIWL